MKSWREAKPSLLASPLFVCSLLLLVANDFLLKQAFPGWLTGKLSDLAGLVAATLFAWAFVPRQRRAAALLVALLFVLWKSSYSQPALDYVNRYLPLPVGRTVDYTDLAAIPLAWAVCFLVPHQAWPVRRWLVQMLAGTSILMFGATTCVHTHTVREAAEIPGGGDQVELTAVLDAIAMRYGLECVVCDRLTDGRLYGTKGSPRELTLVASLDPVQGRLLYDVGLRTFGGRPPAYAKAQVDALRAEIASALRARFPDLSLALAEYPRTTSRTVRVYKQTALTSHREPENRRDSDRAAALVGEVAAKFGMRSAAEDRLHYAGRLYGPSPYERELVVSVAVFDSPLVSVSLTRSSDRFAGQQAAMCREIVQRLTDAFGEERVSLPLFGRCE